MILKLCKDHSGLDVYKVNINDDPWLFLTFTARSNLVKIAYCGYTRPRCQVSFYRTIGPTGQLVLWLKLRSFGNSNFFVLHYVVQLKN